MQKRPEVARLRERLIYYPETGKFRWKPRGVAHFDGQFAGKEALAGKDKDGYLKGTVENAYVKAHRVAWAMTYGKWPNGVIDHINGDVTDNRIQNLRSVTESESQKNKPRPRNNTSGVIGVCWVARYQRWYATISTSRGREFLGSFESFEDAAAARKEAEQRHGYHPNHGREQSASAA